VTRAIPIRTPAAKKPNGQPNRPERTAPISARHRSAAGGPAPAAPLTRSRRFPSSCRCRGSPTGALGDRAAICRADGTPRTPGPPGNRERRRTVSRDPVEAPGPKGELDESPGEKQGREGAHEARHRLEDPGEPRSPRPRHHLDPELLPDPQGEGGARQERRPRETIRTFRAQRESGRHHRDRRGQEGHRDVVENETRERRYAGHGEPGAEHGRAVDHRPDRRHRPFRSEAAAHRPGLPPSGRPSPRYARPAGRRPAPAARRLSGRPDRVRSSSPTARSTARRTPCGSRSW